jgi:protein gp37
MGKTGISWTDMTWGPVTGCSKVSPGCAHCYAETVTQRYAGRPGWPAEFLPWTPENAERNVVLHPERLDAPLHWRKPRRVFVNSMSDLFHEQVPDEFIAAIFGVMAAAPQHAYQILTKRPERMREWCSRDDVPAKIDTMAEVARHGLIAEVFAPEADAEIAGWPGYFITNKGRVLSDRTRAGKRSDGRHELKPMLGDEGHSRVMLQVEGRSTRPLVHRLVLETFDRAPRVGEQGCHIDRDATNNARWNVHWGSQEDNWADSKRHGTRRRYSKLTPENIVEIRDGSASGESFASLGRRFDVSATQIRNVVRGEQWSPEYVPTWPLESVWLGVSVENQHWADERIPILLATPAAVRFLSCEPLLGPINLSRYLDWRCPTHGSVNAHASFTCDEDCTPDIAWIIAGGESGPRARPCDLDWLRSLRDQCQANSVAFHLKQLGGRRPGGTALLDGVEWKEFPK